MESNIDIRLRSLLSTYTNSKSLYEMNYNAQLSEFINLDSFRIIHLMVDIEDTFGINFPENSIDLEMFLTYKNLLEYIENCVNNKEICSDDSEDKY